MRGILLVISLSNVNHPMKATPIKVEFEGM